MDTMSTAASTLEPMQMAEGEEPQNVSSLPSADRGKDAWLFLASSFMIEALIWGFVTSFGVMQEYYATHPPFKDSGSVASVGTTASGLMYFTAPVWFGVIALRPSMRSWMIWSGPFIVAAALIGSSFATTVSQLVLTQGVLYGLGGSIIYIPTMSLLDEWFVQRKGLAFGIMWAGNGSSGVVTPLILNAALARFGHRTVLRAVGIITCVFILPFLPFIRPRLPPSRTRRIDVSFLLTPQFVVVELANILQGLGYFIPSIYLPTYASALGAGQTTSALTLVVVNVASVAGSVLIGGLSDQLHATTVMAFVAIAASTAVFLFWGLSRDLGLLFAFCVAYGLSAGGFSSTWPGIVGLLRRRIGHVDVGLVLGFLGMGRGIGNVISGPVSEKLLHVGARGFGLQGQYAPLIVFTGITAICSGFAILLRAKPGFL